eukprot:3260292-Rhodomonas_salina.1
MPGTDGAYVVRTCYERRGTDEAYGATSKTSPVQSQSPQSSPPRTTVSAAASRRSIGDVLEELLGEGEVRISLPVNSATALRASYSATALRASYAMPGTDVLT